MLRNLSIVLMVIAVAGLAAVHPAAAAPWIAADFAGKEPTFPPGSLYFHTHAYRASPLLFRTVLRVEDKPFAFAGFRARVSQFAYVYLNGRPIAACAPQADAPAVQALDVELTHLLQPGPNVLIISTQADGFVLDGAIAYKAGNTQRFATDSRSWKAQKLPPLTILEDEPCMRSGFDDSTWFATRETTGQPFTLSDQDLQTLCERLAKERLTRLDEHARWRLQMLADKGIAIADWEAATWAGPERLPAWLRALAASNDSPAPGELHLRAEALTRFTLLSDEMTNLANQSQGLKALAADPTAILAVRSASPTQNALNHIERLIKAGHYQEAMNNARAAQALRDSILKGRVLNRLNRALDNKFSWLNTTALLDSDPAAWGLRFEAAPRILTSPLSPAALITVPDKQLTIQGWDALPPLRVYNKPAAVGPVCLWAVRDGKVTSLKPDAKGVVYDRATHGDLSENWILLVHDLAKGGPLPIQLVFLNAPARITFAGNDKTTTHVSIAFEKENAQLFALRPPQRMARLPAHRPDPHPLPPARK